MNKRLKNHNQETGSINIKGNVNTGGGHISAGDITQVSINYSQNISTEHVERLFKPIYKLIDDKQELQSTDKGQVFNAVKSIESEVVRGSNADKDFLTQHLTNIGKMAPDILEVVLAVITNPVIGLGVVAQKISQKIEKEKIDRNQ